MWKKFKENFIGDKAFYIYVITLVMPMIIQNAITNFVGFLDNIMVGQLGTEQMSGVAIVNQLMFVFQIAIFGGVSGAGIFGTQFYGKGDYEGQKYAFRFKMITICILAGLAILLFRFADTQLISLYLSDAGSVGDIGLTLKHGQTYLFIMLFGLPAFAVAQAYISSVRETGETFVPMVASICAVVTNLALNYLLIFGKFGFPEMGSAGAAVATVISRYVELLIVAVWTHTHVQKNLYIRGAFRSLYIPKEIFAAIIKKGTPLLLNEFCWASGMAVIAQCYAARGLEVVAAQNISSTIANLFNIVFLQMGGSISIVVGQLLGAGKLKEAKIADNRMIFFCVSTCIGIAALMSLVGGFFPGLYNTEESIKELASKFILISALVMPLCSFAHCSYFTLRSGGKTIATFIFDSVYTWVLVIPIATFLAKYTVLPVVTVYFLVQFTEIFKVGLGYLMVRSDSWLQNIVDLNKEEKASA